MTKSAYVFVSALVFTSVLHLTGCSNRIDYRGKAPDLKALETIKAGSSTKQDVLNTIGSPSFETQYGPKVWYYVSKKEESKAFFPPKVTERQTIAISFSNSGLVTKVEDLDPFQKEIIPVKDKTKSAVPEKPLIKQIFANFGKIAKKDDKKKKK